MTRQLLSVTDKQEKKRRLSAMLMVIQQSSKAKIIAKTTNSKEYAFVSLDNI